MDWSDEVKARLEEDIYAAGNATGALAQVYAADIRAALGEIERRGLQYPDDLGVSRDAAGLSARCAELRDRLVAQGKRAEAAEAKLTEAGMGHALPDQQCSAIEHKALRAEVERLRAALGRVLTEAGLQAHKHGCADKLARPAQWDARLPCAGCQAESALQVGE